MQIIHVVNQDKTDLEKAFDYLIEKGHKAVNVIWATGKRADHTLTNITNIVQYRNQLKIVVIDDHSKVFLLPTKFDKWYTANTIISLIPVGKVSGITTKNLFYSKYRIKPTKIILSLFFCVKFFNTISYNFIFFFWTVYISKTI